MHALLTTPLIEGRLKYYEHAYFDKTSDDSFTRYLQHCDTL
jgi:hypothetical protein